MAPSLLSPSPTTTAFTASLLTSLAWILFLVNTPMIPSHQFRTNADEFCMRHTSLYSPLLEDVPPRYHTTRFNGSFMRESVYRMGAGPEVDEAWEGLGVDYRPLILAPSEALKSGLCADHVQVSEQYGGGYIVNVEALHHLHCLNALRKSLHWNYPYYSSISLPPFSNPDPVARLHVSHCLDTLRQRLMCVPDVGVLGQVWYKTAEMEQPMPFVDFSTEHRCRDFEAVRRWAEERQIPKDEDIQGDEFLQAPSMEQVRGEVP